MLNQHELIAELLYPNIKMTLEELLSKYPRRDLKEDQLVTRIAPSPTGPFHIGGLYQAYLDKQLAAQTGGTFYLRIEDTDSKREVPGISEKIYPILKQFNAEPDEGYISRTESKGMYGPYIQSKRKEYYQVFAKYLVAHGYAYPCFCTQEEEELVKKEQKEKKVPTGYYGEWAKCRDLTYNEVKANIEQGKSFTIRIRAEGDGQKRVLVNDLNRGKINFPENYVDSVLIKSDGLAVYHLAHVVDDTLMQTNLVVRGEEWLSSTPLHLQLFKYLGIKPPQYLHTAQILTIDEQTKNVRKISKRLDSWSEVEWFLRQGYPIEGVHEYVLNLLNSTFEPWRMKNPHMPLSQFKITTTNLSKSGAIFDITKLENMCKTIISQMSGEEIYNDALKWAEKYNPKFAKQIESDKEYAVSVFGMDKQENRPRKDIKCWSELEKEYIYMFKRIDDIKEKREEYGVNISKKELKNVLTEYLESYEYTKDNTEWFKKVQQVAEKCGFASNMKEYRENPEKYKGNVADVSTIIRVAITGRKRTPNLCEIIYILGEKETKERIINAIEKI